MNVQDVCFFVAILEHGSLQRAAAVLGLSQPALSKCVQRLEKALNTPLFIRGPVGMTPTPAAEALRPYAIRLAGDYNAAFNVIGDVLAGEAATVRVGVTPAWEPLVSKLFLKFSAQRPATKLDMSLMVSDRLVRALQGGLIDFGIATLDHTPSGIHSKALASDTLRVVARRSHPVHQHSALTLAALQPYPWLAARPSVQSRQQIETAFSNAGLARPQIQIEVDGTGMRSMLPLLASKDLLGVCPQSLMQEAMKLGLLPLPLASLQWPMTPLLISRADALLTPVAQAFMDMFHALGLEYSHQHSGASR